ncbi:hypothetical protein OCT63_19440 [Vibrio sp. RW]|uniref:hypothetical protein n=1 Tax=Vibrio sp. RW TaxID=2998833 RepID=UPI0022CD3919|nr:hypothetical protein [Vibrio sp. RW]MDA0146403.1 hypothetical protein [Vibrio sp. RW]
MSSEVLRALKMREWNKQGFLTWLASLNETSLKVNKCTSITKFKQLSSEVLERQSRRNLSATEVDDALSALLPYFPLNRLNNLKGSYSASKNRDKAETSSMTLSTKNIGRIQEYVSLWNLGSNDSAITRILDICDSQRQDS